MPLPIFIVLRATVAVSALWALAGGPEREQRTITERPRQAVLGATQHPPVPIEDADAWFVPDRAPDERERQLAAIVRAYQDQQHEQVLALAPRLASERDLGGYARLYQARAYLAQENVADARRVADRVASEAASPYLGEQARLLAAAAAMRAIDHAGAIAHLEALMKARPLAPERALLLLGQAQALSGNPTAAALAFTRVHYEFPLSPEAVEAGTALDSLGSSLEPADARATALRLQRAERLFAARRHADARQEFELLRGAVRGSDQARVELRLAQIDYQTGRHSQARDALARMTGSGPLAAEARYFHLLALRDTGQTDGFVRAVRELADDFPGSTWAAEALDALGTYYVRANEDDRAARVFTELFDRFPGSDRAERAAWMAGWRAYRTRNFDEAIRLFERAAADMPRANKRADWLYWAARARAEKGDRDTATARYKLVLTDYAHSYYGRQAARRLGVTPPAFQVSRASDRRSGRSTEETARDAYPNGMTIHRLLRAGLYDEALGEMRAAEQLWGSSAALQATIAWATREQGDLLRASVLMKRAYPQYLAESGARLPEDVLRVTYPVNYWSLIRRHAIANKLDPYLIAALIAQESGYNPSARSAANAWGLMQIIPATGSIYARKLGIKGFTTRSLTDPEINIRIGTAYFADQIERLGSVHAALAGYNAGPTRARRWSADKPGLERDEWIDDIPFPETQFYVKRILGTAEDYRALYGGGFDPTLRRTMPRPAGASGGQ